MSDIYQNMLAHPFVWTWLLVGCPIGATLLQWVLTPGDAERFGE